MEDVGVTELDTEDEPARDAPPPVRSASLAFARTAPADGAHGDPRPRKARGICEDAAETSQGADE